MLEITIWDVDGDIVVQEQVEAFTATDEQIADMVAMIEGGCPAYLAAQVAIAT